MIRCLGLALGLLLATLASAEPMVHPGCLSTAEDLDRMAEKVAEQAEPWTGSWAKLVANTDEFLDDAPGVQPTIVAGHDGEGRGENYMRLARDAAKAYQLALRFHGSGDERFARKAVEILNAWATTHTGWAGDSNVSLRQGLYGYQLACAAELLRDDSLWPAEEFAAFQAYLLKQFVEGNRDFLTRRHGTVPSHYWANWGLANVASILAIGVVCDQQDLIDEAVEYYLHGEGYESIEHAVTFDHPNGLAQWQESGRDQGHALMGPQLAGVICEVAWNQGIDLYAHDDDRLLRATEYLSKYNLGQAVPFEPYVRVFGHPGRERRETLERISDRGRGQSRPGWDLILHHYVGRLGREAPFAARYASDKTRPEGGGFNYGSSSGGFDSLGFTTLTHGLESANSD